MKWIDIPPVWLLAFLALAFAGAWAVPSPMLGGWAIGSGQILVLIGLALMAAAVWAFRGRGTSVLPHQQPRALIAQGIYRWSRNPIYLGDALIMVGWALWLGALIPFLVLPVWLIVIVNRFIRREEALMSAQFGDEYLSWASKTRRWI